MKPLVYLAGPITGESYKSATNWRNTAHIALERVGIVGLCPLRGKAYLEKEGILQDSYEDQLLSMGKTITRRDRFDCCRANMILMNLLGAKKVSIGTMIEVGWADANRIPIVLIMEDDNLHRHSMLEECADYRVSTLEQGIHVVKTVIGTNF